jgi:ferrochelatase
MASGVLLMAHGVARDIADIPRYYAHIRHGRPLSPAVEAELVARYQAIGGHSPLKEITEDLGREVEAALCERWPGQYRVYVGFRHSDPFIADTVSRMAQDGITDAVMLALAPHYSQLSTDLYIQAAEAGLDAAGRPFPVRYIRSWHRNLLLIGLLADRVAEARQRLAKAVRDASPVIFTAHSLPERILATGDPYPDELRETAEAVARLLDLPHWETAWQSAGRTPEPWLGPDILDRIRDLHKQGIPGVVVAPCGFTADHLEVLYDLDIQARDLARDLGLAFERTRSLNADPAFARVIADVVTQEAPANA